MNVNCRVTLTDEQRNTLYRRITGKDVKRMVSRKEVCELVNDFIDELLRHGSSNELAGEPDQAEINFPEGGHDDCCRANALLLKRVNILQHRLDTGR